MKRYIVDLTAEERNQVHTLCHAGKVSARKLNRAHVLLLADEDTLDTEIAETLHIGLSTVERIRKRFVEQGLEGALSEHPRPGAKRKLDGKAEATLVAWTCSAPPDDRSCWTRQLLADKLVELKLVASISDETVRRTLKKTT